MAAPSAAESGGQSTASATNTNAGDDRLPTAPGYSAVSAGGKHTCRLDAAGIATCWGANGAADKGQADPPAGAFTAISAGYEHTCGLRPDGTAVCWGDNSAGQSNVPSGSYTAIAAGYSHTFALNTDAAAVC